MSEIEPTSESFNERLCADLEAAEDRKMDRLISTVANATRGKSSDESQENEQQQQSSK